MAEKSVLGVNHAEVGGLLLAIWGLPYDVVEAVAYHHQPSLIQSTEFDLLTAVHIANALTHDIASSSESEEQLDLAHLESLGLIGDIPAWREQAAQSWNHDELRSSETMTDPNR